MITPELFAKNNNGITPSSFSEGWLSEIALRVPLYQRLFVWEEEQISQLFEDLRRAYRERQNEPYFIGTLTVYRHREEPNTWDLVDGQQRITVLTLLGIACSQKCGQEVPWDRFLKRGDGSRLQYFARKDDEADLRTLMESFG